MLPTMYLKSRNCIWRAAYIDIDVDVDIDIDIDIDILILTKKFNNEMI